MGLVQGPENTGEIGLVGQSANQHRFDVTLIVSDGRDVQPAKAFGPLGAETTADLDSIDCRTAHCRESAPAGFRFY